MGIEAGSSTYYQAKRGIVQDGLVLHLDAGVKESYNGGSTWYDLSGNTNVTLINGPSSNRNRVGGRSVSFDGTNQYARPTITHSYLSSSTIEIFFYLNGDANPSNPSAINRSYLVGYRHNHGYSYPTIGSIFLQKLSSGTSYDLRSSVITHTQAYRYATSSASINKNTWYQVALIKDTTNGTLGLYKNGISVATQTFDAIAYGQWTGSGSYIGNNQIDIGKSSCATSGSWGDWGNDYLKGFLPIIRIYDHVLSSDEISQNFNATRHRFGL